MSDLQENATNRLLDILRDRGSKERKTKKSTVPKPKPAKKPEPTKAPKPSASKPSKSKGHVMDFLLGDLDVETVDEDSLETTQTPESQTLSESELGQSESQVTIQDQPESDRDLELIFKPDSKEEDGDSSESISSEDSGEELPELQFALDAAESGSVADKTPESAEESSIADDSGEDFSLMFKKDEDESGQEEKVSALPEQKTKPDKHAPDIETDSTQPSVSPTKPVPIETSKAGESSSDKEPAELDTTSVKSESAADDIKFDLDALTQSLDDNKQKDQPEGSTDFDFDPLEPDKLTEKDSEIPAKEESIESAQKETADEKSTPDPEPGDTTPKETEESPQDENEDLFADIDFGAHKPELGPKPESPEQEHANIDKEVPEDVKSEDEDDELKTDKTDDEDDFSDFEDELEDSGTVTFVYQKEKKFSLKYLLKKFHPSRSRIGLDIGSYAIKYILADDISGEISIQDFGYYKIPSNIRGNEKETASFIKKTVQSILTDSDLKKLKLNLLISGSDIGIKNIQMPKVGKKELQEAVKWSTKKHLSFSADESVLDFKVIKETVVDGVPKLDILVVAALEAMVERKISTLSGLKIPTKILPTPLAMWRYYVGHYPIENLQNVMVIDIGHETTMINVIHDQDLRFAREIGVSGKDFTEALIGSMTTSRGERINVEEDLAELFKFKYGFPLKENENRTSDEDIPLIQLSSRLRSPMEKLAKEIQRSIQYYANEFSFGPIDKIYLCGGTAGMLNITDFLADYLNMDVQVSNPLHLWSIGKSLANVDVLEENATALATPAGISIDTSPELNLLPEKYVQETQTKTLKTVFRLFLLTAVVSIISLSTTISMQGKTVNSELVSLKQRVNQMSPMEKEVIRLQDTKKDTRKKVDLLKKMFNEPTFNVQFLRIISNIFPESVSLESFENTGEITSSKQATVRIIGYIETTKYDANVRLAELVMRLENSGYMKNVILKDSQPVDSDSFVGLRFDIQCQITDYEG
ncbi:MAG: type IV pilus assembly protein PilM [FCB group bacterium]|nr:type IV pilus assembly protein PilM [FCB group bacterium]